MPGNRSAHAKTETVSPWEASTRRAWLCWVASAINPCAWLSRGQLSCSSMAYIWLFSQWPWLAARDVDSSLCTSDIFPFNSYQECAPTCVWKMSQTIPPFLYIRSERPKEWLWKKSNVKSSPWSVTYVPVLSILNPPSPSLTIFWINKTQLPRRHPSKGGLSPSHILKSLSRSHAF